MSQNVRYYQSNNDFHQTPVSANEAIADALFEMETGTAAFLIIGSGLTKDQALAQIDNLRWLVKQAFENPTDKHHGTDQT